MRAIFVTCHDILNECKSGGAQCGIRNYKLLCDAIGSENVTACVIAQGIDSYESVNVKCFRYVKNKFEGLIASFCGTKLYMPYTEKQILYYIFHFEEIKGHNLMYSFYYYFLVYVGLIPLIFHHLILFL